jgi:hypothetical protein
VPAEPEVPLIPDEPAEPDVPDIPDVPESGTIAKSHKIVSRRAGVHCVPL